MKWGAGVLLALLLAIVPMQCYRDGVEWKAKAEAALERVEEYRANLTRIESERDSALALAQVEREARGRLDADLTRLRARTVVVRPAVEAQLDSLPDAGVQARQLIGYLDSQIATLEAKVVSQERELVRVYEALATTTVQRDLAYTEVTRLEAVIRMAPVLQMKPRRRLLGLLPHPGDFAIFIAGAVTATVVLPKIIPQGG